MNRTSRRVHSQDNVALAAAKIRESYSSSIASEIRKSSEVDTDVNMERRFSLVHLRPLLKLTSIFIVAAIVIITFPQWMDNSYSRFGEKEEVLDAMESKLMQASSIIGLTLLLPFFINWILDLAQGVCFFVFACDGTLYSHSSNKESRWNYLLEMTQKILGLLILAAPLVILLLIESLEEQVMDYFIPSAMVRDLFILCTFEYVLLCLESSMYDLIFSMVLMSLLSVAQIMEIFMFGGHVNGDSLLIISVLVLVLFIYRSGEVLINIIMHKFHHEKKLLDEKRFLICTATILNCIICMMKVVDMLISSRISSSQYIEHFRIRSVLFNILGNLAVMMYTNQVHRVQRMENLHNAQFLKKFYDEIVPCVILIRTNLRALRSPRFMNSLLLQPQCRQIINTINTSCNYAYCSYLDIKGARNKGLPNYNDDVINQRDVIDSRDFVLSKRSTDGTDGLSDIELEGKAQSGDSPIASPMNHIGVDGNSTVSNVLKTTHEENPGRECDMNIHSVEGGDHRQMNYAGNRNVNDSDTNRHGVDSYNKDESRSMNEPDRRCEPAQQFSLRVPPKIQPLSEIL